MNYFTGKNPAKWRRNIPTFSRVKYPQVYPGVDLVYYGNQRQLEYDFVLAPGADPRQIEVSFDGANRLRVDGAGNLVLRFAGGEVIEHAPVIYQVVNGVKRHVIGGYKLKDGHSVGFKLVAYNHRERLTIDPGLIYSTYLGGSNFEDGFGIAVNPSGNAYVTGRTYLDGGPNTSNFPTTAGALQTTFGGVGDAFVSKLNSNGTTLIYSTYLGGSDDDEGYGIAVDSSGNAYITGVTLSSDFPTTAGALQSTLAGNTNAFVTKLNSNGSALLYSTYLGGSEVEDGLGIAVDSSNNSYVTGATYSNDFPTTAGALQTTFGGNRDAFVSKLNSNGSALLYSTYLGGSNEDEGEDIAVDSSGNAYVSGLTYSSNFPTTRGALQSTLGGNSDAFISKLNNSGSALIYSTYLGGSDQDFASDLAVDSSNNAYVTGTTFSSDFPTTVGALQTRLAGFDDAFVTKLNSNGSALIYSTYLGGSNFEDGLGIAVDSSSNTYVSGQTYSSDFPTTADALQTTFVGLRDAFVSKLNNSGSALIYSTYLGGGDYDPAWAIAADSSGNAYVTGSTVSSNFPTTAGAFQTTFGGGTDAFVSKIWTGPTFAGQPGRANCHGKSVSALSNQYGSLDAAASALSFPSVQALQNAIRAYCGG